MLEEYNSIEKRLELFYNNMDIENKYDRMELEKEIIERVFNDFKDYIPNEYLKLNFCYSGLLDEGYTRCPIAVCDINGINIFIDLVDAAVNYSVCDVCSIREIRDTNTLLLCREILFTQSAWLILHEMTHAAEIINIDLMYNPTYVALAENTADAMAADILRDDIHASDSILSIIWTSCRSDNYGMIPVMRSVFESDPFDYTEYYYQSLKEALQIFGTYDTEDGRYIISELQRIFYADNKDIVIIDQINDPDNKRGIIVRQDGYTYIPNKEYAELINKLFVLRDANEIKNSNLSFGQAAIMDGKKLANGICISAAFLYDPFVRGDFLENLNLSDVYTNQIR